MGATDHEAELRAVNEEVYKHSLELVRLKQSLETANEKQETLMHFIGHEVKGFLTKNEGVFAALIEGDFGELPEALKPIVTRALTDTRLGVISVSSILKAANLKKGIVTYTKESFDLNALVAEAVEKARSAAEQKGLTLFFTAADDSYQMTGDREQLSDHVFRNLIDNAINYTPSGSISISLEKDRDKSSGKDNVVFKVKDTGIGITDEDKARLFTEGGHGKDSQKINVHSTGYGLFIAKSIVEAHGGTIRAESLGAGKGATFTIELPA